MEMSKSAYKRKRIDVACPAQEDASSFYKRLGLDILDTSWKSEEAEPPRKRAVHNEIRIAPQNSNPTPRPDRVVPQCSQPQQTAWQAVHSVRNFQERSNYNSQHDRPHGYRTDFVNGGPKYQAQHPTSSHPHGYMNIASGIVKSGPVRHQHSRPHSRTESYRVDTTLKAQPAPLPQRVVKKEPQVKPINRYAPPEYVTLMYHPTPTLEDLGLTSYLDSPPSSPRSVSPDRGSEAALPYQTVSVAQHSTTTMKSEERLHAFSSNKTDRHLSTTNTLQGYTPSFAPKGWVPPKAVHKPSHGRATAVDITRPASQSALTSRPHHTAANTVTRPAMVENPNKAARDWNHHLSTNTPQGYTPSFAPKGWVPPKAVHKPSNGQSALTSRPHHTAANTVTRPAMVENPNKAARDWLSNDGASIDKTENSFGGVTPHSCSIDQRFS